MQNINLIYSIPYKFNIEDFGNEKYLLKLTDEKMKKTFIDTNDSSFPIKFMVRMVMKKSLKLSYGIYDSKTAQETIDSLLEYTICELISDYLYNHNKTKNEICTKDTLTNIILELNLETIVQKYIGVEVDNFYDNLLETTNDITNDMIQDFELIELTNGRFRAGFDCARTIAVIGS